MNTNTIVRKYQLIDQIIHLENEAVLEEVELLLKQKSQYETNIKNLLREPEISAYNLEHNYHFDASKVEGMWPGDEPIEELLAMLNN
jgi:hypothetical protein